MAMPFDQSQATHRIYYGGQKFEVMPEAARGLRNLLLRVAQRGGGDDSHYVFVIEGTNLVTGESARYELLIGPGIPVVIEGPA